MALGAMATSSMRTAASSSGRSRTGAGGRSMWMVRLSGRLVASRSPGSSMSSLLKCSRSRSSESRSVATTFSSTCHEDFLRLLATGPAVPSLAAMYETLCRRAAETGLPRGGGATKIRRSAPWCRLGRRDLEEQVAGLHLLGGGDREPSNGAGDRRGDRRLHLHRLDRRDRLAGLHRVAVG